MDPLSFTASLMAVIGAAGSTASVVEKLLSLRYAGGEVAQLLNNIEDLKLVLLSLQEADEVASQHESAGLRANFNSFVDRAGRILSELDRLVHNKLVLSIKSNGQPRISYLAWLRKRSRLAQLRASLRDLTESINAVMAARSLRRTSNIQIAIDEIRTTSEQNISATQERPNVDTAIVKHQIENIVVNTTITNYSNTTLAATRAPTQNSFVDGGSIMKFRTYRIVEQDRCSVSCRCECHTKTTIATPNWLNAVVGQMFYSYVGTPFLGKRSCNRVACKGYELSKIHINYHFPAWIAPRVVICQEIRHDLSGIGGSWSLHIPRFVSATQNWARLHVCNDNTAALQRALDDGTATVWDVDENGMNLLEAAIREDSECTQLLVRRAAIWDMETQRGVTTAYIGWQEYILDERRTSIGMMQESLKRSSSFSEAEFSGLHLIVTGLSNVELEGYLELHEDEVLEKDLALRSPIMWAARMGNLDAFRTLLHMYGDSTEWVEDVDYRNDTIVFQAIRSGNEEIVKDLIRLGADLNAKNYWGSSPLMYASGCNIFSLLIEGGADIMMRDNDGQTALHGVARGHYDDLVDLLLDCGADIEARDRWHFTPLLRAVFCCQPATAAALLRRGADPNVVESTGLGAVAFAAVYASVDMMRTLLKAPKFSPQCSIPDAGEDIRCPWCLFVLYRPRYCSPKQRSSPEEELAAFAALMSDEITEYHFTTEDGRLAHRETSFVQGFVSELLDDQDTGSECDIHSTFEDALAFM